MKKKFTDLLFMVFCIPVRLLIVYIVKYINPKYLPYLGWIGLCISIGFLYQFIMPPLRKKGVFGEPIWWSPYRPIHSFLFLIFFILAELRIKYAYIPLLLDAMTGIFLFCIKSNEVKNA